MRVLRLHVALLLLILLASIAWAGAPRTSNPGTPPPPPPQPNLPSPAEYGSNLERRSHTSAYYQVYRCSRPTLGQYTTVFGRAITDSHPHKSRYLAHNVRLFINGRLVARHPDIVHQVHGASEHNFITSIPVAEVSVEVSCPRAFILRVEAESWHKGISIHGSTHAFYTRDSFYG
jgi:hypothetical protein